VALTLVVLGVLAGCAPADPSASAAAGVSPAPSPSPAPTPTPGGVPASPAASPTPAAFAGPIAGAWRVRKILAPDARTALVPGSVYGDEAYDIRPTCASEPCPSIEVAVTPLGRAAPRTVTTLTRHGDVYESDAQAQNDGPCINAFGDRIPGGAAVSQTLRLWLTKVRPAGTAVESEQLNGSIDLALAPTAIGSTGGCTEQTATYDLTGRRGAVAVATSRPTSPPGGGTGGSGTARGPQADLPRIGVKVPGATIDYFDIEGTSAADLVASLAQGGVDACGVINYEWHQGDQRPAACTITAFPGFERAIGERTGTDGSCTISRADVRASFVIHFPRWSAPKRVPSRLLAWWRDVVTFIRDHEAEHVRISREAVAKLDRSLKGADCEDAPDIIQGWARALSKAQEAFDRAEYAKPWPRPPAGY
jgi:predicted secreted Zn-dependent protease